MMKTIKILSKRIAFVALISLSACKESNTPDLKKDLVIKGSESEKLMVQYLANHYNTSAKDINIEVKGGGSEYGISEFKEGACNIANSSRVFQEEDYAQVKSNSVKQAIIGVDAIAIITHPTLGIGSLNLYEISQIYLGRIKNWKELGGPDLDIMPIGRKEGSGTRQYMQHRLNVENFSDYVQEFSKYEEIVAQVSKNKNAIGYVSLKHAMSNDGLPSGTVWVMPLSLEGAQPKSPFDKDAIAYGEYALIRPLFQYYLGGKNPEVEKFINFELSSEGQELIQKVGFYPINDFHKQINKLKM